MDLSKMYSLLRRLTSNKPLELPTTGLLLEGTSISRKAAVPPSSTSSSDKYQIRTRRWVAKLQRSSLLVFELIPLEYNRVPKTIGAGKVYPATRKAALSVTRRIRFTWKQ